MVDLNTSDSDSSDSEDEEKMATLATVAAASTRMATPVPEPARPADGPGEDIAQSPAAAEIPADCTSVDSPAESAATEGTANGTISPAAESPADTADAAATSASVHGSANGRSWKVGDLALVPADVWPDYPCNERDGSGWLARIKGLGREASEATVHVRFLHARDRHGRRYPNETLLASVLQPVESEGAESRGPAAAAAAGCAAVDSAAARAGAAATAADWAAAATAAATSPRPVVAERPSPPKAASTSSRPSAPTRRVVAARNIDGDSASTAAGALDVGTRLSLRWRHGWEDGTVADVLAAEGVHTYLVAYDDGDMRVEDLRKRRARLTDSVRPTHPLPAPAPPAAAAGRNLSSRLCSHCPLAFGHRGLCSIEHTAKRTRHE